VPRGSAAERRRTGDAHAQQIEHLLEQRGDLQQDQTQNRKLTVEGDAGQTPNGREERLEAKQNNKNIPTRARKNNAKNMFQADRQINHMADLHHHHNTLTPTLQHTIQNNKHLKLTNMQITQNTNTIHHALLDKRKNATNINTQKNNTNKHIKIINNLNITQNNNKSNNQLHHTPTIPKTTTTNHPLFQKYHPTLTS